MVNRYFFNVEIKIDYFLVVLNAYQVMAFSHDAQLLGYVATASFALQKPTLRAQVLVAAVVVGAVAVLPQLQVASGQD